MRQGEVSASCFSSAVFSLRNWGACSCLMEGAELVRVLLQPEEGRGFALAPSICLDHPYSIEFSLGAAGHPVVRLS